MTAALANSISRPNTRPAVHQPSDTGIAADARLRLLPSKAREKFERLRRAELLSRALADGLLDQIERVREQLTTAQRDLGIFDRKWQPEASFDVIEDEKTGKRERVPHVFPERVALTQTIDNCKTELARLQDQQHFANLGYSTEDLLGWLTSQPASARFVPAAVGLKLNKGETLTAALASNGDAQATITEEIATAQNAPRTKAEARAAMRDQIARLAEKGRPDVANLFRGEGVEWPTDQFIAGGYGAHEYTVAATVTDTLALITWAQKDAITAALDHEIERAGDDAGALSAEAQAAKIAELEANLLGLRRQAEAIYEQFEMHGQTVRRTCVIPEVILGIERARQ